MSQDEQNRPNSRKYVCNIRFLVVLIVCIIIVLGAIGYFAFTKTDEKDSNNGHDQNENNGNHNDTITVETTTLSGISKWENNEEIQIFREYLRIRTVHPNPIDYKPAVAFLQRQAASLNLPMSVSYPVDDQNPVVVMTWKGTEPELPSIMLNSHMDVVPAYEEFWTHPPFAAEMDENGDIFARGAQDMKSVGMQYLGAIRALKREGVDRLKRTVHIDFVPDEEVSDRGMVGFVKTDAFKLLNVGFALDEGSVSSTDDGSLEVYYGERTILQTEFIVHGQSGHGSLLLEDTPGVKMTYLMGKLTEYREEEARKFNELKYPYGNVTTINLTIVKGGVQPNVVPAEMRAVFDIRVSVNQDLDQFMEMLHRFCDEAGGNITINYLYKGEKEKMTVVDASNEYWVAFKSAVDELGLKVIPTIMFGTTDIRFIRNLNISALNFSPLINTVPKLHDHDEYLNADVYLNGIEIYKKIIQKLGNV